MSNNKNISFDSASLQLDFVYGYHGSRCRDNLVYTPSGEILYHIAAVGIVYNPKTHTQKFYQYHTDDIISLTAHPTKPLVATGQIGKDPFISIWDSTTQQTVAICKGFHERGICSLGFSNDGNYLVSVGLDDDHTIAIWEWAKGRVIASDKGSKERVFDIQLSPYSNTIVTCGVKHIKFWTYSGNTLVGRNGIHGKVGDIQTYLCIFFGHEDGKTYTGTLNGDIYIWENNQLIRNVAKAHKGPVYVVTTYPDGFMSGGKDSQVKVWTRDFKPVQSIPLGGANIRSLFFDHKTNKFLVGTKDSEIWEVQYSKDKPVINLLIEGHGEGELWGLATCPVNHHFVTASDDKKIKIWDGSSRKCLLTIEPKLEARSAGFSPDGSLVAVGFLTGHHAVYKVADGKEVLAPTKGRKEEISVIKFSPDGKFLGVGSHDNFVDIYATGTYKKVGICTDNASYITHFDWDVSSKYIKTNSGDYQELVYEITATSVSRVKGHVDKLNAQWATTTTTLSKDLVGIWPPYSDKTDVNTVDKSKHGNIVVTGDDFGLVKLYPYPTAKGAKPKSFIGHSAHVTAVAFAHDSSYVITTGGGDQAVFQWKVLSDGHAVAPEPDFSQDPFDSDIERENNADYVRFEEGDEEPDTQSGMLFQVEEDEPVVMSGNPAAAAAVAAAPAAAKAAPAEAGSQLVKKKVPGGLVTLVNKPKSGTNLTKHVDRLPTSATGLDLDFVYGYRGYDTRNNLFYNKDGRVVYHVAAVGLIYDTKAGTQQQFIGHHTDDILCLGMHPDGKLVVTGEIGKRPKIIVWDSTTGETDTSSGLPSAEKKATLQGFHERAVTAVAFSPDGQYVASVGLDDWHSVAVWDWKRGIKIADGRGSAEKILTVDFNPNDSTSFVTCGVKHIKFWKVAGNALIGKLGIFGTKFKAQTQLSAVFDNEFVYSAANEGQVYKWKDNTCVGTIDAHKGPIFTMYTGKNGKFLTGGKDGKVKVWSAGFAKVEATFEIGVPVRSVSYSKDFKILVGTQKGGIFEVDERGTSETIIQGHAEGELWGLATHPSKQLFVTASDDAHVYVWDADLGKQVAHHQLEAGARSAAYSPAGDLIAIGHLDGRFSVHEATTLKEVYTDKRLKEAVHEIKFSPDGKYLAVGSHDDVVDFYSVANWTRTGRCSGNSSYITHLDFTADGDVIVTNSGDYQQLVFQVPKGTRVTPTRKAILDFKYATHTRVLGEDVAGIWPPGADGTDVNSLDRAHDGDVVATGDDFGFVKLFPYPAPLGAQPRVFPGHSSHVTNVRFSWDDEYLISTGGMDTAIFQWKYKEVPHQVAEDDQVEEVYDSDIEREKNFMYVSKIEGLIANTDRASGAASDSPFAFAEAESEALFAGNPFNEHESAHGKHDGGVSLELEYVHGYRAHDARNNLFYTASGNIVYHVAGTGIVLDPRTNTQKFFLEHTDDIVSLAYHAGRDVVVTGEVGKTPKIIVWNAKTQESLSVLRGIHKVGIAALDFDATGEIVASVGLDNDHTIAIYSWRNGITLASGKGDGEVIFDIVFNPFKEHEFVTVGVKHVKFWKIAGSQLEAKKGIFGKVGAIQTMVSAAHTSADTVITGGASGELFEWKGQNLTRVIAAHNGPCYTLNAVENGEFLSGGKDGKVLRWGADFKAPKETIEVGKGKSFTIRSVAQKDGVVLVGTISSEIYQIPKGGRPKQIASGHADGELWGLATNPTKATEYATASDDKTLRVWDSAKRAVVKRADLRLAARSVDYSPDGRQLAVGYSNGSFGVFDAGSLQETVQKRNRKEAIHEIKFSPNGKYLAVGSHDNFVDVYQVSDWKLVGTAKGNSSYITHLDWSKDSKYIQTNSGAYEHLLYEVLDNAVRQVVDRKITPKLHDFNAWHTWTGVLGDEVDGIWPPGSDGTDVNALDVLTNGTALATGDDFGFVKVLPFPAPKSAHASAKRYPGHSAHVTNVRFTSDDGYLISTGGGDRSIFQWKVRS